MKKLYVVGIGPGEYEMLTIKAAETLRKCDLIIGYKVYVNLVHQYFPDKEFMSTPMKEEAERCHLAYKEAQKNKVVAMISSGDAGIYGMSGLMYEIGAAYPDVELEIIAGITAASSGGAVLGAPLIHDFAVISLSDLLTPWEVIEKRLIKAAEGDFSMVIYNPSSHKRADYLERACTILKNILPESTVCGYVKNIGREGECFTVCTLGELAKRQVDMFTTVFIGNSVTKNINGKMITPRGYHYEM